MAQNKQNTEDGGHYALKGYIFQFDKSLIEVLSRTGTVEIEHVQDLSYGNYYVQIKNRETQKYAPSKIFKAVSSLLELFKEDQSKRFLLYAHFKDKPESGWVPSKSELDQILGTVAASFTDALKEDFLKKFKIIFAPDFKKQFTELIGTIKKTYRLMSDEEAVGYHAILQYSLIKVALKSKAQDRKIDQAKISAIVKAQEAAIFYSGYREHLGKKKYLAHIKKEYFTQKKTNLPNHERLFVIETKDILSEMSIIQIASALSKKYFKLDGSPAPYICLRGLSDTKLTSVKQKLWDKKMYFTDGTHFAKDRFRMSDLIADTNNRKNLRTLKVLDEKYLEQFLKKNTNDEIYTFFTGDSSRVKSGKGNVVEVDFEKGSDILSLIT
jgi:type III secretory pathway component EscR